MIVTYDIMDVLLADETAFGSAPILYSTAGSRRPEMRSALNPRPRIGVIIRKGACNKMSLLPCCALIKQFHHWGLGHQGLIASKHVELLSCSWRLWEFAGKGFRIIADMLLRHPFRHTMGPFCCLHGQPCNRQSNTHVDPAPISSTICISSISNSIITTSTSTIYYYYYYYYYW